EGKSHALPFCPRRSRSAARTDNDRWAGLRLDRLARPGVSRPPPTLNCAAPATSQADAPAVGSSASYDAATAGSATVARVDATTLKVASTAPHQGWTASIIAPSGPKVRVTFYETAKRGSQVRLTVALDHSGKHVH